MTTPRQRKRKVKTELGVWMPCPDELEAIDLHRRIVNGIPFCYPGYKAVIRRLPAQRGKK